MGKVKFNVKTLDKDTRHEYPASSEFVEVSEAFYKRLKDHDQVGESFELENAKPELFKEDKPKKEKA